MKVVIIGGGLMGTSVAVELASGDGTPAITVLERSLPGAEASTAAAGMLAPQLEGHGPGPFLDLMLLGRAAYPGWVRSLEDTSRVATGYLDSGALKVAMGEDGAHALEATVRWQAALGLRAELVTGPTLRALEPGLSPAAVAAAHFPDDAQVDPRRLMRALVSTAASRGVSFRPGTVRGLAGDGARVHGVHVDDELVPADVVVVAAGAWSPQVAGVNLSPGWVKPARGQMVELDTRVPAFRHILSTGTGYLVPRADGHVVAGSTMELVGFDKRVTADGLLSILTTARSLVPALGAAEVSDTWSGLRPWTADGLPLLGPGGPAGLILATGHFRNGILLAPITARLVGQLVRGQRPTVDLSPFGPGRFAASR